MRNGSRAHGIAFVLLVSGCMASPPNSASLVNHDAPVDMWGLTAEPGQGVSIGVYDWCTDRIDPGGGTTSSREPTVFEGVAAPGDATGYVWNLQRSYNTSTCRYWTPYGCNFADWGANQGTLRLKPSVINTDGSGLTPAFVFSDPAFGETNVVDCANRVSFLLEGIATLSPLQAAAHCADSDGLADLQTRHVSSTWSVDFSGTTVLDEQEEDDEELYNPVIVGFRGTLQPNATLTTNWINDLSEREIGLGGTYGLDDRNGRIHFRNVDTVSIAEFLGCDPATARINVAEFQELAFIGKKASPTPEELARAVRFINGFRCTLNQTPKDIAVVGWALSTIESDNTPISVTKNAINDALKTKRAQIEPQLRTLGTQLAQVRTGIREIVQFCNDTATWNGYSAECMLRFKDMDIKLETAANQVFREKFSVWSVLGSVASLGGLTGHIMSFLDKVIEEILDCIVSQCDNDDAIGDTIVRPYLAIDADFWTLLTSRIPSGTLPEGTRRLAPESYNISTSGNGAHYQTAGKTANFTTELRTSRLASERARNANRCPWLPPAESTATGVTM
jgi:hypothetical protein